MHGLPRPAADSPHPLDRHSLLMRDTALAALGCLSSSILGIDLTLHPDQLLDV